VRTARLLLLAAAVLMYRAAGALPADLDPSFGAGGVAPFTLDQNATPISVLQPDGSVLVASTVALGPDPAHPTQVAWLIRRFKADGGIDTAFGPNLNGSVLVSFDIFFDDVSPIRGADIASAIALVGDGRFVVAGRSVGHCLPLQGCELALIMARFDAHGDLDQTFGTAGKVTGTNWADALAIQSDGRIVAMTNRSFAFVNEDPPLLTRFNGDGSVDESFAPTLACAGNGTLHLAQQDTLVVAATPAFSLNEAGFCVERIDADGTHDATFGTAGVAAFAVGSSAVLRDFFIDGTGGITLAGFTTSPVVARLAADGRLDSGFGAGGIVTLAQANVAALAGDCRNRTLVAGASSDDGDSVVLRLLPDGTVDPAFTGAAQAHAAGVADIFVRPDGRLLVVGEQDDAAGVDGRLVQLQGDAACSGTTSVEYYNAAWDAYFVSALPGEIAALDAGAFGGVWVRTGESFGVWSEPNGANSTTCRFVSTAFAERSSHFYTPFAQECAHVMADPSWLFEANAFFLQLANDHGACAIGTVPLYRAYNAGMGGAPNHRYTTRATVLDQMLARGWIFEGDARTRVFACVPG
jgi:uncharacterized delta-60 repeat protein